MPSYKLMKHENKFGWGVSLVKYGALDTIVGGFVLNTFPSKEQRDRYAGNFKEFVAPSLPLEWDIEL